MPRTSRLLFEAIRLNNMARSGIAAAFLRGFDLKDDPRRLLFDLPGIGTRFLGKDVLVEFQTGGRFYSVGRDLIYLNCPLGIRQARLASCVIANFHLLSPTIVQTLKSTSDDFGDDTFMKKRLSDPKVFLDHKDAKNIWSFQIDRIDTQGFYHLVFDRLRLIDSSYGS